MKKEIKMANFIISLKEGILSIGFSKPATNDQIVKDVHARLEKMLFPGGSLLLINGPSSLPVMATIIHRVSRLYGAVAVFVPKLKQYVVCTGNNAEYKVGDLLDEEANVYADKKYFFGCDPPSPCRFPEDVLKGNVEPGPHPCFFAKGGECPHAELE